MWFVLGCVGVGVLWTSGLGSLCACTPCVLLRTPPHNPQPLSHLPSALLPLSHCHPRCLRELWCLISVILCCPHCAQGRTTLVIAHRLSTVRNCDNIAVIDKGALNFALLCAWLLRFAWSPSSVHRSVCCLRGLRVRGALHLVPLLCFVTLAPPAIPPSFQRRSLQQHC